MANYRQLFPNLTDADFLAPGVPKTNGNANYVVDWAEHDNTDHIPYSKLPDLSSNGLQSADFSAAGATDVTALAAYVASFNANAAQAGVSNYTAGQTLTPGDTLVLTVTDTTPATPTVTTFSFIFVGDGTDTPVTADGTATIAVGEFRDITSSSHGVISIQAGAGIQLSGTESNGSFFGDVTIASTPSIAPYTVNPATAAEAVADGEVVVLGPLTGTTDVTVTLPGSPTAGASIKFVNLHTQYGGTGTANWVISGNGLNIMGQTTPLELDDRTVSFELVFTGLAANTFGAATNAVGWVIIGAN